MKRRDALRVGGLALAGLVAGCTRFESGSGTPTPTETTTEPPDTTTSGGTPTEPESTDGTETPDDTGTVSPESEWRHGVAGYARDTANGLVLGVHDAIDEDGSVFALDAETGEERWTYGSGSGYEWFTSLTADDAVYFGRNTDVARGGSGVAYAVEFDGEERWTVDTGGVLDLEVGDEAVFVTEDTPAVSALGKEDGDRRWRLDLIDEREWELDSELDTVIAPDTAFVAGQELLALDRDDGEIAWTYGETGGSVRLGAVDGGTAFVNTADGLAAVADGEEQWTAGDGELGIWGLAAERVVARRDADGAFVGFDAATGEERWTAEPTGASHPDVELDGDMLYVAGESELHAVDASTGDALWTGDVGRSPHVTAVTEPDDADAVYVRSDGNRVQRFDPEGDETWTAALDGDVTSLVLGDLLYVGADSGIYAFDPS